MPGFFNIYPGCLRLAPTVRFKYCQYLASQAPYEALFTHGVLLQKYSCVHEPPCVLQYPHILHRLSSLWFGNHLAEVCKYLVLPHWCGWGLYGYPCVLPEVPRMFFQCGALKATKDQVIIRVVPGFLGGHVHEEMTVRPHDLVRPGPRLSPQIYHTPHPTVLVPGSLAWKRVHQHILDACRF